MSELIPVDEALRRVLAGIARPVEAKRVPLRDCAGRWLAEDAAASRTQPPFANSAMDGWAVRAADIAGAPVQLKGVGTSAAGHRFAGGAVGPGEAVRIFTGAPLPPGADTVVIQENARVADDGFVEILQAEAPGRHVRPAGLDFRAGEVLLEAGIRLDAGRLALAAAAGHAALAVRRKPRLAILATGDELVLPGEAAGPDQIVASNGFALAAMAERAGAEPLDLGIAPDRPEALAQAIAAARGAGADLLVTLGGASVGEHDLVRPALLAQGMEIDFWRVALRPGKPLLSGRIGDMLVLGLPGNPVSSIVCAILFVVPAIGALLGDPGAGGDPTEPAVLGATLRANDARQDYLRARLDGTGAGLPVATPFEAQDSSMIRVLARAGALLVRPPQAPAARAGDPCRIVRLSRFL